MCLDEMGFYQPPAFGSHKPAFTGSLEVLAGLTVTCQYLAFTPNFVSSSTVFVDVTDLVLTIPVRVAGCYIINMSAPVSNNTASGANRMQFSIDTVETGDQSVQSSLPANDRVTMSMVHAGDLDGQVIQARHRVTSGTGTVFGSTSGRAMMATFEASG